MAAQKEDIQTNNIKAKIDKTQENSECRMFGKAEEGVNHVLSKCSKLDQKEYKRRHDWFGIKIHWKICRKYGIEVKEKWYEHEPEVVMENEKCKILWDFTVQTDHEIYGRRPDVIVVQKDINLCQIIDSACPCDGRVDTRQLEKTEQYQDLARQLRKIWNMKVKVIPLVIGALGTTPIKNNTTILLHTARILRKVLEIYGNLLLLELKNINPLLKQCVT